MAQAGREQNHVTTGLGWDGTTTATLKADSATQRLLLNITSGTNTVSLSAPANREQNHVVALLGELDDSSGTLVPIACDSNGYILMNVTYT